MYFIYLIGIDHLDLITVNTLFRSKDILKGKSILWSNKYFHEVNVTFEAKKQINI